MSTPNDMEFDRVAPPEQRRAAARAVAGLATDAKDCAELLAMLGLTPEDGVAPKVAKPPKRDAA